MKTEKDSIKVTIVIKDRTSDGEKYIIYDRVSIVVECSRETEAINIIRTIKESFNV